MPEGLGVLFVVTAMVSGKSRAAMSLGRARPSLAVPRSGWGLPRRGRSPQSARCILSEQLMQLYSARQRRRLNRGLRRKQHSLLKRLRKAKKEAPPMEKPEVVKTHLRDMIILPEMVGSMVGVYNGKTFNQVEIKVRGPPLRAGPGRGSGAEGACAVCAGRAGQEGRLMPRSPLGLPQPEMIGHYLGEFSITYKPVKHGRPGIGATHSSRFIPLK
ncbi:40S ribosomal protein S15 [Plecturocebus cupreus]